MYNSSSLEDLRAVLHQRQSILVSQWQHCRSEEERHTIWNSLTKVTEAMKALEPKGNDVPTYQDDLSYRVSILVETSWDSDQSWHEMLSTTYSDTRFNWIRLLVEATTQILLEASNTSDHPVELAEVDKLLHTLQIHYEYAV